MSLNIRGSRDGHVTDIPTTSRHAITIRGKASNCPRACPSEILYGQSAPCGSVLQVWIPLSSVQEKSRRERHNWSNHHEKKWTIRDVIAVTFSFLLTVWTHLQISTLKPLQVLGSEEDGLRGGNKVGEIKRKGDLRGMLHKKKDVAGTSRRRESGGTLGAIVPGESGGQTISWSPVPSSAWEDGCARKYSPKNEEEEKFGRPNQNASHSHGWH